MKKIFKNFEINDENEKLQIEKIHLLLKKAYWCKGIPQKTIQTAIDNSLCFGVYKDDLQIGFARVVTDYATFAWLCDVIIETEFRVKGLSKILMSFIMEHPKLQNL